MTNARYNFNKTKFKSLYSLFARHFSVYYPIKANDDDLIVSTIKELGGCFETDTIAHIKDLIKRQNIKPSDILYSIPIRSSGDILTASKLGVDFFVVDSIQEYNKTRDNSIRKNRYLVRLNIVDFLSQDVAIEHKKWGCELHASKKLIQSIIDDGGEFCGVSFYFPQEYCTIKQIIKTIDKMQGFFNNNLFKIIDIGGGISVEDAQIIGQHLKSKFKGADFIIEPGRYLLNPCIEMECAVVSVFEKYGKKYVILNTSIYSGLIDIAVKGKRFEIEFKGIIDDKNTEDVVVCGLTSDDSDFIGIYKLPYGIKPSDKIKIKNCGAYSSVMQTQFYKTKKSKYRLRLEL